MPLFDLSRGLELRARVLVSNISYITDISAERTEPCQADYCSIEGRFDRAGCFLGCESPVSCGMLKTQIGNELNELEGRC